MSWMDKTVVKWVQEKGKEASLSGSQALDVFRKRSSVSAFRIAALCQYLYQLSPEYNSGKMDGETIHKLVRKIYLYMAEYILESMLTRWGKRFEELNTKREAEQKHGPKEADFSGKPQ